MFQIAIEIIVRKNKQVNKALKIKEHLQSERNLDYGNFQVAFMRLQ